MRSFAGDLVAGAVQAFDTVSSLRAEAARSARIYVSDPDPALAPPGAEVVVAQGAFRSAYRCAGSVVLVVDQHRLPDAFAEVTLETAADAARIISALLVRDAPVTGHLAALGLSLTASRNSDASALVLHALLDGSANLLLSARPTDRYLTAAVTSMMDRVDALEGEPGPVVAIALEQHANAMIDDAAREHARMAQHGRAVLTGLSSSSASRGTLHILTHGATGPLATGQVGSALGVIEATHRYGAAVHVWVSETRPGLEGARLTTWELASAGVAHTLVPDAAVGHLIATGRVGAIVVGALRIAANGDVANVVGTYPLAVLAARHGVPFVVCALRSSIDLEASDAGGLTMEGDDGVEVLSIRGIRVAPVGTAAANPHADITPAELVTAIVTADGVVTAPFGPALASVASSLRLPAGPVRSS